MRPVDPGHYYKMETLDGKANAEIKFVKRVGPEYPGNANAHSGVTAQEVLRVLIDRIKFVNTQKPHPENSATLRCLRDAMFALESRAAEKHGYKLPEACRKNIELMPTCPRCGHVLCNCPY